jgi:HK97 family phage major capsid protein
MDPDATLTTADEVVREIANGVKLLAERVTRYQDKTEQLLREHGLSTPQRLSYTPDEQSGGDGLGGSRGKPRTPGNLPSLSPECQVGTWLQQALAEGSGSGSFIVPDEQAGYVWDRLAAASVGLRSGFRIVDCGSDTLRIPRVTADAASAWVAEAGTISPADPTISEVVATPRKLAVLTQTSTELVDDSNPAVLEVLASNLLRSLALKLDLGFYEGSGTAPEIRGLKNQSGIGTVSLGANGSTPVNVDPFADAISTLEIANAEATAIVMHPRTWQTLSKIKEVSGSTKPTLIDSAGSPTEGIRRSIYGVPVWLTSQLSILETQGTSTDASSAYVYQADQVVAVRRIDVRYEVDRSRLFNSDQIEVRAICRWDLVLPNPAAVVRVLGIRP